MILKRLIFIIMGWLLLGELAVAQTVAADSTAKTVPSTAQKQSTTQTGTVKTQPQKSAATHPGATKAQPTKPTTTTKPGAVKSQPQKTTTTQRTTTAKPQPQKPGAKPVQGQKKTAPKKVTTLDEKKYRGMADMGFSWGIGNGKEFNRFGFSTTHGYQVVPIYLFIGGGVEVDYYSDGNGCAVPLFLDLRTNFKAKVSPFIDARVGGSPFDLKGFYVSPSFGIRIPIKETKYGISLMAGYTLQTADLGFYYYSKDVTTEDKKKMGGIHFKVGFEW